MSNEQAACTKCTDGDKYAGPHSCGRMAEYRNGGQLTFPGKVRAKRQYILRNESGQETAGVASLSKQREALRYAQAHQASAGWFIVRQDLVITTVAIAEEVVPNAAH